MKKAYHYFVTVFLWISHPTNHSPSFAYFCKHIEGDSDEDVAEAIDVVKKLLPKHFK